MSYLPPIQSSIDPQTATSQPTYVPYLANRFSVQFPAQHNHLSGMDDVRNRMLGASPFDSTSRFVHVNFPEQAILPSFLQGPSFIDGPFETVREEVLAELDGFATPLDQAIEHYKQDPRRLDDLANGYGVDKKKLSDELDQQGLRTKPRPCPKILKTPEIPNANPGSISEVAVLPDLGSGNLQPPIENSSLEASSFEKEKETILKNYPDANGKTRAAEHYKINPTHPLTTIAGAYGIHTTTLRKELEKQQLRPKPKKRKLDWARRETPPPSTGKTRKTDANIPAAQTRTSARQRMAKKKIHDTADTLLKLTQLTENLAPAFLGTCVK